MPATTTRRNYTVTAVTDRQIEDLADWWGGLKPAPAASVIREAILRAWQAESQKQKQSETRTRTRRKGE